MGKLILLSFLKKAILLQKKMAQLQYWPQVYRNTLRSQKAVSMQFIS